MFLRALSALVGVTGLWSIWYFFKNTGLVVICSLVSLIACLEFSYMVEKESQFVRSLFVFLSFSFFLLVSFFSHSLLLFLSYFILLVSYFLLCSDKDIDIRMRQLTSWTVGILYCGAFTGVFIFGLHRFEVQYFVAALILSFVTDTFAYLGGRSIGRTPLAPVISPKKTLEGSVVGLIGGSGFGFWYLSTLNHTSPTWVLVFTCLAASLFGQVGDLFESAIKRQSGVKDSGKILPGHGGILDRIDGVLFASSVVLLWMQAYLP